jgi:hypothetical protein
MAQEPVHFVGSAGDQPTGQSGAGNYTSEDESCVDFWVGHEYSHDDSASLSKSKLTKKQGVGAVHGPCYALVCDGLAQI